MAALAADDKVMDRTGSITSSWDVGATYGLSDYDGRRPNWGEHFEHNVVPSTEWLREAVERHVDWLDQLSGRGHRYLGHARVT